MTVNVTNAVGANNTIVLDGSSKIPAFDGSLVTALSATAFTTGTLATARIDVGTTAGKILQLDGSARMPALSGANLVNAPGPTSSTSDPAIDTNSTLGAKWINKTSGEVYICTDATTDENVWTNVGAGTGDIEPAKWYGPRGCWGGGEDGSTGSKKDVIDYITISTLGNAADFGNLLAAKRAMGGASGNGRGLFMGGGEPGQNVIQYITIASVGNATDFGDLTSAQENCGGLSSGYRGVRIGGAGQVTLDYVTIATTGNATDFGDTLNGNAGAGGLSNGTYGLIAGGNYPNTNTIEKITIATTGNTVDWADLTTTPNRVTSYSSDTRGIWSGGYSVTAQNAYSNVIEYVTIATQANATDFGDLLATWAHATGVSDAIKGVAYGGWKPGGGGAQNLQMQYVTIATTGNSLDFGDSSHLRQNGPGPVSG